MTRQEASQEACGVFALAYQSLDDFSHAADGFCCQCPFGEGQRHEDAFRNDGHIFEYVRRAVLDRLAKEGIAVAEGFDPATGREERTNRGSPTAEMREALAPATYDEEYNMPAPGRNPPEETEASCPTGTRQWPHKQG